LDIKKNEVWLHRNDVLPCLRNRCAVREDSRIRGLAKQESQIMATMDFVIDYQAP
jgi:hypothetical protein